MFSSSPPRAWHVRWTIYAEKLFFLFFLFFFRRPVLFIFPEVYFYGKKPLKKSIFNFIHGKTSTMKRINKYLSQIIGYHNLLEWNFNFDKHIYIFHGCKNIISCNISMFYCAYKILYFIPCKKDKQFVSCRQKHKGSMALWLVERMV